MCIYIYCDPGLAKETTPDRLWPSRFPPRTKKNEEIKKDILIITTREKKTTKTNLTDYGAEGGRGWPIVCQVCFVVFCCLPLLL